MALWRDRFMGWKIPIVLLGVALLSYGLWIPWWGLFGNDLPYLWYYHLLGPMGPGEFAAMDRPVSALFYAVVTLVFGEQVWLYHVLLLVLRWLSAVLLWRVLRIVWPERNLEAAFAALLLVVYPGFRQNPVALEFILHLAVLNLFFASLCATLLAVTRPRQSIPLAVIAAAGAAGLFSLEYFIGLEILRPVFLWIITRRQGLAGRRQWQRILLAWAPALTVVAAFLFWRVFIFSFPTYRPVLLEALRSSPLDALGSLLQRMAKDVWTVVVGAWQQVFRIPEGSRRVLVYAALILLGGAGSAYIFWSYRKKTPASAFTGTQPGRFGGEILLGIGFVSMLAGGSVFWLTGIPVSLAFPWDRSTLSFMVGASLFLTGLFEILVAPRYRLVLASLLIGLAVGLHFQNALEYRAEWQKLQQFYWQLTWRAPDLEPGTLILFDVIPLNRYSDSDMTALLNWTYAPELRSRQLPYKFFDLTIRLDSEHVGISSLEKDIPVEHNHRGTYFQTSTSNTLALTYSPPACLRILRPADALIPDLPESLVRAILVTRLEQIRIGQGQARPPHVLGQEPAHDWCYYFQRADLALQQENWVEIAALGDRAFEAGLHWNEPSELLPFIEGYARAGLWESAEELAVDAGQRTELKPVLCALMNKIGASQATETVEERDRIMSRLGCSP